MEAETTWGRVRGWLEHLPIRVLFRMVWLLAITGNRHWRSIYWAMREGAWLGLPKLPKLTERDRRLLEEYVWGQRIGELATSKKQMVERFLSWKLPNDFAPDGGISFDGVSEPVGTNLLNYTQAEKMVEYMVKGDE